MAFLQKVFTGDSTSNWTKCWKKLVPIINGNYDNLKKIHSNLLAVVLPKGTTS